MLDCYRRLSIILDEKIEALQKIINASSNIVFFGGAGVSTESGIPDFRSQDGLYQQQWNYPPETILSHSFFTQNPKEFYRFYTQKMIVLDVQPNKAHLKLVELEKIGKLKSVITQNIDGLHQKAGSKQVWELHGSVLRNYCQKCGAFYSAQDILTLCTSNNSTKSALGIQTDCTIPRCTQKEGSKICDGIIKPDVILYGEGLSNTVTQGAIQDIMAADTLIIGGTSLIVYPAAGLINYFKGKNLVLINRSKTTADTKANLIINDSIGEVMGRITI